MPQIPFAFQCSFAEIDLLPLKNSINGYMQSVSASNIPEIEYFLDIHPNGDNEKRRGETWIFLCLKFKNVNKVNTDFTFSIESANYNRTVQKVYDKSTGWGYDICKTNEFFDPEKKYIIDGKFTVKVHGVFKFGDAVDTTPAATVEQKWGGGEFGDELWERNDTKDFTILVNGDKEIEVHKFVISHRSDIFAAMLNSNMKETIENKVAITDFPFNVVEAAFKIIYNSNFTTFLTLDELMSLLQFFDKYQLSSLKAKVEPLLINQISAATVCRLTNHSLLTNSFKLKEKCMEFLSAAFSSKIPLHDFKTLDKDIAFEVLENSFYQNLAIKK